MFQNKFTFRCPSFWKRKGKIVNYFFAVFLIYPSGAVKEVLSFFI
jgi:hypothetical protein